MRSTWLTRYRRVSSDTRAALAKLAPKADVVDRQCFWPHCGRLRHPCRVRVVFKNNSVVSSQRRKRAQCSFLQAFCACSIQFLSRSAVKIVSSNHTFDALWRTVFGYLRQNLPAIRRTSAPQLPLSDVVPVPKHVTRFIAGLDCAPALAITFAPKRN